MTSNADAYAWALARVTNMRDRALIDATVYGEKLLRGHGYPNEVFGDAQNYLALALVLDRLEKLERDVERYCPSCGGECQVIPAK